ncbi:uncharacterized protein LOC133708130 [Rosa rugosa]|uniref:uncharacterized protein LOC133708130 n=1 Tax=Rosa rugosa TaxID=74645 RepID=UPI002B414A41|nr:uncharacterized protein LOC133708130 [Rosa rugosa]XP_061989571.1 uncharacterized protein LOC133708130 [Rosa rugosa]XP_061989572.1 uncharacterized protein LOC133708130 [Rosa rugosa]XP_061989573.1 uncharacterized protein LOC133708130 [Rosa rugosa]XP_061989574.1 uncharacterized protein LOC133708130 [Rosa rugosa]
MEVMIDTLVICGCLVFGGSVIKRLLCSRPRPRPRPWETLPDDVMEMVVRHLSVRDRIRLSSVCKSWNTVPMRRDIPSAPHQLPWLILPQCCHKSLTFYDLYDGKVGKLDLPEPVQGGWFQGSSKGWMIMVMEKDLDSTMFLVNPISGAQHQLPSLSTVPSFQNFVETTRWKHYGASLFSYCLVLSTSDITSEQCMIAAFFGDAETLCLCRPGDTSWSICEVLDANEVIIDLLFSSGKLYALVLSHDKEGFMSAPRTLSCGGHAVELYLVYDIMPRFSDQNEVYGDYIVQLKASLDSHLIDSATNGEIYLIHQMQDKFMKLSDDENPEDGGGGGNEEDDYVEGRDDDNDSDNEEHDNLEDNEDGGDDIHDMDDDNEEHDNLEDNEDGGNGITRVEEEDRDLNVILRTSAFYVYKLHPKEKKIVSARCLEDQLLFLSGAGQLSLPAREINKLEGNCIYFATNNQSTFHQREYITRELGIFNLDDRRVQRSFPSVRVSVRSRLSWFNPIL